jgi:ubiquinone/menaquinone biosynthesis C-methylase UbiE
VTAEADIDPAAVAFGGAAADYERARPTYPPEIVDALGLRPGARVCDLAAGTGKFTRLLVTRGFDVVAVEPVDGMRAQLAEVLPDVGVVEGTAEAIPLPDASVDAVTVAQAFHWFRFDAALAEIARVLVPGGLVAIVFNERDERVDWIREWNDRLEWHGRRIAYYQRTDWTGVLTDAGFGDVAKLDIEWTQPMTRELLAARVRSVSYIAIQPEDAQQQHVEQVLALTDGFDEPFDIPYVTHLWWASKQR